jgi:2,5-diamino-6-(ribosylamino)-4(3H)-pyrimidinone 5'-phosphate reductase
MLAGQKQVNLRKLLTRLWSEGIRRLLLEGGSTLNWNMLEEGLVDEIRVSVAPYIVGGEKAKTLVGGKGFPRVKRGIRLRLKEIKRLGTDLLLVYRVEARRC